MVAAFFGTNGFGSAGQGFDNAFVKAINSEVQNTDIYKDWGSAIDFSGLLVRSLSQL